MGADKSKKIKLKYCLLSNDVESTSIWLNTLRDETAHKVYREGMPVLLDIYSKYNIKSTFFYTGYIAKLIPDVVKMIINDGHEVASHGMSHIRENGFDVMPLEKQIKHLKESKKLLEDISGKEVISFRAPALRVNNNTANALIEAGFKIDSSIAAQRFDMFLSFGGLKKLKWMFAPRLPYLTSKNSLFKKGEGPIVEVPLSAFFMPYVGTTMRIFPTITNMQKRMHHIETCINKKPVVFDIHPNEFIDESSEERVINRRTGNAITYFFQDFIRAQLKVKNLGAKAIPIYESQIKYFKNRGYIFTTIQDYCKETGLLK